MGRSESAAGVPSAAPAAPVTSGPANPRARWWPAIGLAALAVVLGLGWMAWKNSHGRRSPLTAGVPPEHQVVRPADMPALGYLPEPTEAVLAVQIPELMEKLGPDAGADPAKALRDLGVPDSVVDAAEKVSAVGLRNVDQLVVGVGFQDGSFPPQIVVVVQTRGPYDLAAVAHRAKARQLNRRDGRTLYATGAAPLPEVYWWAPSDRVLVGTLFARDFERVPLQPREGTGHLPPELGALIRDQLPEDACAWVAATSDRWDEYLRPYTILPFTALRGRTDLLAPAGRLRSVTLAIPHGPDRPVDLRLGLKSADAAAALRATFADRYRGEPVEVTGESDVCRLEMPFQPARVGFVISRLIGAQD